MDPTLTAIPNWERRRFTSPPAEGTEKTRTITRAELMAIHTALTTFASHELIGIFTDSLASLQAIRHYITNPSINNALHYHSRSFPLGSITDLLET
jgi:ribonuclease HI